MGFVGTAVAPSRKKTTALYLTIGAVVLTLVIRVPVAFMYQPLYDAGLQTYRFAFNMMGAYIGLQQVRKGGV